jgi:hypothetical protein
MLWRSVGLHLLGPVPLLGHQVVTVCTVVQNVTLPVLGVRDRDAAERREEEAGGDATNTRRSLLVLPQETRHGGPIKGKGGLRTEWQQRPSSSPASPRDGGRTGSPQSQTDRRAGAAA